MAGRTPRAMLVIGQRGGGKTYVTTQEVNLYRKQYARPVLIIDVNNEYSQYKAIKYDARIENNHKRSEGIRSISLPRIYRIIGIRPDNIPMTPDELKSLILTIADYFRNGVLVLDEMNSYIPRNVPERFYAFITNVRHRGVELYLQYQSIGDPRPDILRQIDSLRLHYKSESVRQVKDKFNDKFELTRIAELIVEKYYLIGIPYKEAEDNLKGELEICDESAKQGIKKAIKKLQPYLENYYYFNIYIDYKYKKIRNISESDFREACRTYLFQNKFEIKDLMEIEDENGRVYKSKNDAVNKLVDDKLIYIS